jgi:hypothetical protein
MQGLRDMKLGAAKRFGQWSRLQGEKEKNTQTFLKVFTFP